jgi:hypothetical protein
LIRFKAQTRSASKAIFAAIAASIFRLVFVVIIRSVYHDRTAFFQLRPWSHFRVQLTWESQAVTKNQTLIDDMA